MPLHPTVSPLSALILQGAAFLKQVICQHKMAGPCRQISSYWLEVFAWIKKTTGMVRSPCNVCMCFKALTVV